MPIQTHPLLFNAPQPLPSASAVIKEASKESTDALIHVLRDNHEKTHIFFNDRGFHNHVTHHAIALWAFSASPDRINQAYLHDLKMQRKPVESPEAITKENFANHLADENYYNAYMSFFAETIKRMGAAAAVEEFVFSNAFNFSEGSSIQMLDRLVSGLWHPLIHVGYGLEFNIPGMVVEGLAQAAIHSPNYTPLLPESLFKAKELQADTEKQNANAITLLHQIQEKIQIPKDKLAEVAYVLKNHAEELNHYIDEWLAGIDGTDENLMLKKVQELEIMDVVIYGVSGLTDDARGRMKFRADFARMHIVTSSLFIRPFMASLTSPRSKVLLLRAYFATDLAVWVSHGPAHIDIPAFYQATQAPDTEKWDRFAQEATSHGDDHISKLLRALIRYDRLHGQRKAGEIEGSEALDGTLFLRVAKLTSERQKELQNGKPDEEVTDGDVWDFMQGN